MWPMGYILFTHVLYTKDDIRSWRQRWSLEAHTQYCGGKINKYDEIGLVL